MFSLQWCSITWYWLILGEHVRSTQAFLCKHPTNKGGFPSVTQAKYRCLIYTYLNLELIGFGRLTGVSVMNLLVYYSPHWLLSTTTLGQLRGGEDLPLTAAGHQGAIEPTKSLFFIQAIRAISFDEYNNQWFVSAFVYVSYWQSFNKFLTPEKNLV